MMKTKDSTSMLNKSNSKIKDYSRMGTVRTDSSKESNRFKFKPKVGKSNALVQTNSKMFEVRPTQQFMNSSFSETKI